MMQYSDNTYPILENAYNFYLLSQLSANNNLTEGSVNLTMYFPDLTNAKC